jgi:hypothetical protein
MPTLFNRAPKNSYQELLKLTNTEAGLDTNLRTIEDGTGTVSPLSLSTTQIALNGLIWPTTTPGTGQVLSVGAGDQLVWANANGSSVMPVLTYQGVLGTTNATLATASQNVLLDQITLVNTTTSTQTVTMNIVPSGGTASVANAIFAAGSILAGQTVVITTEMTVLNGSTIQGFASASGVTINLSGNGGSNIRQLYYGVVPTSATAVYTVPASTTITANSVVVCNSSGSAQTFSLNFTNGGAATNANAYLNNVSIGANTTLLVDLSTVLPTGWTVNCTGSSNQMSVLVTGF